MLLFVAAWSEIQNYYYYFLTANGVLPGESGTTIRHNIKIAHITQNNTPRSNKTAHKTTQTIKDTLHCKYDYNYNYIIE
jgi:ferritin-like protein